MYRGPDKLLMPQNRMLIDQAALSRSRKGSYRRISAARTGKPNYVHPEGWKKVRGENVMLQQQCLDEEKKSSDVAEMTRSLRAALYRRAPDWRFPPAQANLYSDSGASFALLLDSGGSAFPAR